MARTGDLLVDLFERVREVVHEVVDGLSAEALSARPDPDANSIAWLVWHLTRIQDDHIAGVADVDEVWQAQGWMDRFALPFDAAANGYGQTADEVGLVRPASAELLTGYYDAVHQQTITFVGGLEPADLDRVVDEHWDPPVTLAVRLVSVLSDNLQHAGQAAFVRGLVT
jgi:uncharacterized damage-inducible protein DinB